MYRIKIYWAYSHRGLKLCHSGGTGRLLEYHVESSHLEPQAGLRKWTGNGVKAQSQHHGVLPLPRPYLLDLSKSATWGPSIQTPEYMWTILVPSTTKTKIVLHFLYLLANIWFILKLIAWLSKKPFSLLPVGFALPFINWDNAT